MKLTSKARNKLPSSVFALPGRKYPVEDRAHAINAKARATQMANRGILSPAQKQTVFRKANRKLGLLG